MNHRGSGIVVAGIAIGLLAATTVSAGDEAKPVAQPTPGHRPRLVAQMGHSGWVASCAFTPDGRQVLTAGALDKKAILWDADTGMELKQFAGHSAVTATFAPDGKRVLTGGVDGTARLWDADTGKELKR